MKDKTYNNADSFSISFDEEWQKVNCNDITKKIERVIEILSDHPFVISNQDNARKIAKFRIANSGFEPMAIEKLSPRNKFKVPFVRCCTVILG